MFDIVIEILLDCVQLILPLIGLRITMDILRTFLFQG